MLSSVRIGKVVLCAMCRLQFVVALSLWVSIGIAAAEDDHPPMPPPKTASDAGCTRETISTQMSPNGDWVALIQEDVCSDGWFVTTVDDAVQVTRRGEAPQREGNVLVVDTHGVAANRPVTRWLSSRTLQITIPNKSLIGLEKQSYEEIEVVIKFEPDDPAERERWLKDLGLRSKGPRG